MPDLHLAQSWSTIGCITVMRLYSTGRSHYAGWALALVVAILSPLAARAQPAPVATGVVTLDCAWTPEQGLQDCHVVQEDPEGVGLGASALVAMKGFKLVPGHAPRLDNGRMQLRVRVPLPKESVPVGRRL
jgi:hypothetical protein